MLNSKAHISQTKTYKVLLEKFSREDLVKLYIEDNLSRAEIVARTGLKFTQLGNLLWIYGIAKEKSKALELVRKTFQKNYGVDYALSDPNVRAKGKEFYQKNYGVDHNSQVQSVLEKRKRTTLGHYGVENPSQCPEILDKKKRTWLEKYGCENPMMSFKYLKAVDSHPNREFERKLVEAGLEFEREYSLHVDGGPNRRYDFKVGDVLIEIDPTATHNSTVGARSNRKPKSRNYHLEKTQLARHNGLYCVHIFDWTDQDQVIKSLQDNLVPVNREPSQRHWCLIRPFVHHLDAPDLDTKQFLEKGFVEVWDDGQTEWIQAY